MVPHIFIKLSQNVCLIDIHILIYWHARFDRKLWKALWFYYVFWPFSYIIIEYSCLNSCISTKLSLIIYLINTDTSKCHMWLQVMPLNFITFFLRIFHKIDEYSCLKYCISIKLLRIVCLINTFILIYWYVRCTSYGRFPRLIGFLAISMFDTLLFIKLSKIL